jgi:hypothetical protein
LDFPTLDSSQAVSYPKGFIDKLNKDFSGGLRSVIFLNFLAAIKESKLPDTTNPGLFLEFLVELSQSVFFISAVVSVTIGKTLEIIQGPYDVWLIAIVSFTCMIRTAFLLFAVAAVLHEQSARPDSQTVFAKYGRYLIEEIEKKNLFPLVFDQRILALLWVPLILTFLRPPTVFRAARKSLQGEK